MDQWGVQQRLRSPLSCRPLSSRRCQEAPGQYLCSPFSSLSLLLLKRPLISYSCTVWHLLYEHLTFGNGLVRHKHTQGPTPHTLVRPLASFVSSSWGWGFRDKRFPAALWFLYYVNHLILQPGHFWSREWLSVTTPLLILTCNTIKNCGLHLLVAGLNQHHFSKCSYE